MVRLIDLESRAPLVEGAYAYGIDLTEEDAYRDRVPLNPVEAITRINLAIEAAVAKGGKVIGMATIPVRGELSPGTIGEPPVETMCVLLVEGPALD